MPESKLPELLQPIAELIVMSLWFHQGLVLVCIIGLLFDYFINVRTSQ